MASGSGSSSGYRRAAHVETHFTTAGSTPPVLVGVGRRAGVVQARLEADAGRRERVVDQPGPEQPVLRRIRHGVVDDRRQRERVRRGRSM